MGIFNDIINFFGFNTYSVNDYLTQYTFETDKNVDVGSKGYVAVNNGYMMGHHVNNQGVILADKLLIGGDKLKNEGEIEAVRFYAPNIEYYEGKGHITADIAFIHAPALHNMNHLTAREVVAIPYHEENWSTAECDAYISGWLYTHHPEMIEY